MGRAHEVRASSMAKTAAKKSAANGRAAKEIYMAAKNGGTDPNSNLALRTLIDKAKSNQIPSEVIQRAIKRAQGSDAEVYLENQYEGIGPGNISIIVESLTSNVNRASANIKDVFNKNKGNPNGKVAFNFEKISIFAFEGFDEETVMNFLIEEDVDFSDIETNDNLLIVTGSFKSFNLIKKSLDKLGIENYVLSEIRMVPVEDYINIKDEETKKELQILLDRLDELEDVQNIYHNALL